MAVGLTTTNGRKIAAAFITSAEKLDVTPQVEGLRRVIPITNRDQLRLYGIGDLSDPEWNAQQINYQRPGAMWIDIDAFDTLSDGVTFDDEDTARLAEVMKLTGTWGVRYRRAEHKRMIELLKEGDTTNYGPCITAAKFFQASGDAGHIYPEGKFKGAQYNYIKAALVSKLASTADPTSPTEVEWQTKLDAVLQYIFANWKNTAGEPLFTGDEPIDLWVPTNMFFRAKQAFLAGTTYGGENVYKGAIRELRKSSLLTDTAEFYIQIGNAGIERPLWHATWDAGAGKGLYDFAETSPNSDSYVDSLNRVRKFSVVSKQKICYGDPRLMFRVEFS